ncbi:hypothetical protein PCK1_000593 [Pneumocystis canis]|nr:hypothetical protein PCK1_000593 [Pneumocystis canis]
MTEENDLLSIKLGRMKRSIQRLRLERAFIFEKLEERTSSVGEDSNASDSSLLSPKREKGSPHSETHDPSVAQLSARDTTSSFIYSHAGSSNATASTRRKRGTRDPDVSKRPSNPFLKFCDIEKERIRSENEGADGSDVTRGLDATWQNLDDESKKPYYNVYELEKKHFKIKIEQYENENSRTSGQQSNPKSLDDLDTRMLTKIIDESVLLISDSSEFMNHYLTQFVLLSGLTFASETYNHDIF